MNRGKRKARHIAANLGKLNDLVPADERRAFHFAKLRKPLNKIPLYMRLIGRRGADATNKKAA